jgi:hypothetical protein
MLTPIRTLALLLVLTALTCIRVSAQDTTEPVVRHHNPDPAWLWGAGPTFGVAWPVALGRAGDLLRFDPGFSIGFQVRHDLIFLHANMALAGGEVVSQFSDEIVWPEGLDFDGMRNQVELGCHLPITANWILKPALCHSGIVVDSESQPLDTTGHKYTIGLVYGGASLGLLYRPIPRTEFAGFECVVSAGWPYLRHDRERFPGAVVAVTLSLVGMLAGS